MLTEERALHVMAFAALIDQQLCDPDTLIPRHAAQNLLARLSATGLAHVASTPDGLRLTMWGITATSNGAASALLRDWQHRAKDRLQAGVQR